jgi:protein-disulfide isomerase
MINLRQSALLVLSCLAIAAFGAPAAAKTVTMTDNDIALGNPKAKVTVVEYASLSCSHCAHFNTDVFPAFKAKYIDTGKVRYVFREFLTEPVQVAAAGYLTARCAGKQNYFKVVDGVFRSQAEIFATRDLGPSLTRIAKSVGIDEDGLKACLSDDKALKALSDRVARFSKEADITSTPTFVVNGNKLKGGHTLEDLDTAISEAKKAPK